MGGNNHEKIKFNSEETLKDITDVVFNKKFTFRKKEPWNLPGITEFFSGEVWQMQYLQDVKTSLNEVKSQLNEYPIEEWSLHTARQNPAGDVHRQVQNRAKPELFTRAWTKFFECVSSFNAVTADSIRNKKLNSFHICEAPGAFIACLNHYIRIRHPEIIWNWTASTLNPYYEGNKYSSMISDDRFLIHTIDKWEFGVDYSGDLLSWDNHEALVHRALKMENVSLVTADGSIDCSLQPDMQEDIVAELIFCEVITALRLLADGGSLVLKVFTMFEEKTVNILYMLCSSFNSVNVFKPFTSKEGNSEVYIVCLGYTNSFTDEHFDLFKKYYGKPCFAERCLFPMEYLPVTFIEQVEECVKYFYDFQSAAINRNISTYGNQTERARNKLAKLRFSLARAFIKKYQFQELSFHNKICFDLYSGNTSSSRLHHGTYSERKETQRSVRKQLDDILLDLQTIESCRGRLAADSGELKCELLKECPISPVYGKGVQALTSSQFVTGNYLNLYNRLCESTSTAPFSDWKSRPKPPEQPVHEWEKALLLSVIESVEELQSGASYKIENPLFVTQRGAGFLYYLVKSCFESVTFDPPIITLNNLISKTNIPDLKNTIEAQDQSERSLMGLIPLKSLRLSLLYNALHSFNCQLFSQFLKEKLSLVFRD